MLTEMSLMLLGQGDFLNVLRISHGILHPLCELKAEMVLIKVFRGILWDVLNHLVKVLLDCFI